MAEHHIRAQLGQGRSAFHLQNYPRNHPIAFKNGQETDRVGGADYKGDATKADPEDLLVASLSSCHMLSFLAIAAKKRLDGRYLTRMMRSDFWKMKAVSFGSHG